MVITIGSKIRELRRKSGATQEMLATALGVTSQAVSRWESEGSYPDIGLIPSIANYFGITIDELFGYESQRTQKIDSLARSIQEMNGKNNGEDVCMDECLRLAREAVAEFPGSEKLMLCLASVLYNAGYVRYGEYHLTDSEGYDIYDTQRHKAYAEWGEAIKLYENVLMTLSDGELRCQATKELMQLYVNVGSYEKAEQLADSAPSICCCKEMLKINACDGKKRARVLSETLLKMIDTCSDLMIFSVLSNQNLDESELVTIIRNAIGLYDAVFNDKQYGLYNRKIAHMYLYLSEHLWLDGDKNGAFDALDQALYHARNYEGLTTDSKETLSSPLLCQIEMNPKSKTTGHFAETLPEDWPVWCVPDCSQVKKEMQADPRWNAWIQKTRESE